MDARAMEAAAMDLKLRIMQQKLELARQAQGPAARTTPPPQRSPGSYTQPRAPDHVAQASALVWTQQQRVQAAIEQNLQLERELAAARLSHAAPPSERALPPPPPPPVDPSSRGFEIAVMRNLEKQTELLASLTVAQRADATATNPYARGGDEREPSALKRLENKGLITGTARGAATDAASAAEPPLSLRQAKALEERTESLERELRAKLDDEAREREQASAAADSRVNEQLARELRAALQLASSEDDSDDAAGGVTPRTRRRLTDFGGFELCARVVLFVARLRTLVRSAPSRALDARDQAERAVNANSAAALAWLRRPVRIVLVSIMGDGPKLQLELKPTRAGERRGLFGALAALVSRDAHAGAAGASFQIPVSRLRVRARAILDSLLERTPDLVPDALLAFAHAYTSGQIAQLSKLLWPHELVNCRVSARDGSVHPRGAQQRRALLINRLLVRLLVLKLVCEPTAHQIQQPSGTRALHSVVERNLRTLACVLFAAAKVACAYDGAVQLPDAPANGQRRRRASLISTEAEVAKATRARRASLANAADHQAAVGVEGLAALVRADVLVYTALSPEIETLVGSPEALFATWPLIAELQQKILLWAAELDRAANSTDAEATPAPDAPPKFGLLDAADLASVAVRRVGALNSRRGGQEPRATTRPTRSTAPSVSGSSFSRAGRSVSAARAVSRAGGGGGGGRDSNSTVSASRQQSRRGS